MQETKDKHLQTAVEMAIRLDDLKKEQEIQRMELQMAYNRIRELEDILKNTSKGHIEQHFSDELEAWKEMVDQQKAILVKIKDELEETQSRLKEKESEVEFLKMLRKGIDNCKPVFELKDANTQTDHHDFWPKALGIEDDQIYTNHNDLDLSLTNSFSQASSSYADEFGLNMLFKPHHTDQHVNFDVEQSKVTERTKMYDAFEFSFDVREPEEVVKEDLTTSSNTSLDVDGLESDVKLICFKFCSNYLSSLGMEIHRRNISTFIFRRQS